MAGVIPSRPLFARMTTRRRLGFVLLLVGGFGAYIHTASSIGKGLAVGILMLFWAWWMSGQARLQSSPPRNAYYRTGSVSGWISVGILLSGFLWGENVGALGTGFPNPAAVLALPLLGIVLALGWMKRHLR